MSTKKELEARIEALEAEIALLRSRPITLPVPIQVDPRWYPHPQSPQVWCGANTSPALKGTFSFNQ